MYISGFNSWHTWFKCVSNAPVLGWTCVSEIFVRWVYYAFNFTERDSLLYDSHRVKKQETLQRYVQRHLTGDCCKYWETEKGVSKHWKLHEYLSLFLRQWWSSFFFSSYPQTHLSDWEDFSCTDSLLSPSACSQTKVNKMMKWQQKLHKSCMCGMLSITTESLYHQLITEAPRGHELVCLILST